MPYDENGNWYEDDGTNLNQPNANYYPPADHTDYGGDQTGYNPGGTYDLTGGNIPPGFNDSTNVEGHLPPGLDPNDPNNYGDPNAGWAFDQPQPLDLGGENPVLKFLKGITGNSGVPGLGQAAGISALGSVLSSLFSKPLFQERKPFTGAVSPQHMLETGAGGLSDLKSQLDSRPPIDFSGLQAHNPSQGMANDQNPDEIRKILQGLK